MTLAMTTAAGVLSLVGGLAFARRHRSKRDRVYAALAQQQLTSSASIRIALGANETTHGAAHSLAPTFAAERLMRADGFLAPMTLARLRADALSNVAYMERSFIPLHKQGSTLCYEQILRRAPHLAAFYHDAEVQKWISAVTGTEVRPTPLRDQSSLSVLCYKDAGDHIGWHYDHNFYRGRHFTVLLVLVNRSAEQGLSHGRLERQLDDGEIRPIEMPENTLVVFEGARVRHRATPIAAGDLRVVLSMTYCDDPRISRVAELARRVKDTAYYGIRALWD
jgi:hypothetical protein